MACAVFSHCTAAVRRLTLRELDEARDLHGGALVRAPHAPVPGDVALDLRAGGMLFSSCSLFLSYTGEAPSDTVQTMF